MLVRDTKQLACWDSISGLPLGLVAQRATCWHSFPDIGIHSLHIYVLLLQSICLPNKRSVIPHATHTPGSCMDDSQGACSLARWAFFTGKFRCEFSEET